jgi:hypothetical protein
MAIEFGCENCGQPLKTPGDSAGKRVQCPGCKSIQVVPSPAAKPIEAAKLPPSRSVPPAASPSASSLLDLELPAAPSSFAENQDWSGFESLSGLDGFPLKRSSKPARRGSADKLAMPALWLLISSSIMNVGLFACVAYLGWEAFERINGQGPVEYRASPPVLGILTVVTVAALIELILNLLILQGAIYMRKGIKHRRARMAAVLAAVPFIGGLSCPFGVWAYLALSSDKASDAFPS